MKAFVFNTYGPPEKVLALADVKKPVPKNKQLLVKVRATTINDYDWSLVRGKPYLYRLMFGAFKPRQKVPGMEVSGIVEGVGAGVTKFKPGDAVYGDISDYGFGTFAEYLCIHEQAVVRKPNAIGFEEAVALPHAAVLALQALRDVGKIEPGQSILINGAGGGVGSIGLQLAKFYGCPVTGVDAGEKLDMLRTNGFDRVVDYREEDFTRRGAQYDLILDCKTNKPALSYLRALKPGGKYVTIGGTPAHLLRLLFWSKILPLFSSKTLRIVGLKPNRGLDFIEDLFARKKLSCVMDGPYVLEDIPRLIQYFGEGKHRGKIVVKIH